MGTVGGKVTGGVAIDRRARAVALARARFTPALDADGVPMAIRAVFMVQFRPCNS